MSGFKFNLGSGTKGVNWDDPDTWPEPGSAAPSANNVQSFDDFLRNKHAENASVRKSGGSRKTKSKKSKDDLWHSQKGHDFAERCYKKHPALKLPGTDLVIYGGSCGSPAVHDAEVYIGFDYGMTFTERHWPWKKGQELLFKITDQRAPEKPEEFAKLVAWTKKQLVDGKKVHCGCIGGHGRTGTFLCALVSEFGEKDAISYVRDNYCQKAVETREQVAFLVKHYGVKEEASRYQTRSISTTPPNTSFGGSASPRIPSLGSELIYPLTGDGKGSIWDARA